MLGPIFTRELTTVPRKRSHYAARVAQLGLLTILGVTAWQASVGFTTEATLGEKVGDWVEIDLGRDRTVGEIDLVAQPGTFWRKFDVMVYATGQRPEEALRWAREVDGDWTSRNRREVVSPTRVSVPYRGAALRFRYLRIVNRSGGPGRLAEIKVIPATAAP